MIKAIKVLENRISIINDKIKETQLIVDEPEMMHDYEFAISDIGNLKLEAVELKKAIRILINN
jgi:ABC-type Zn2+ transport system substrate-binding protein/surface adhesin